jgi:putative transposase
VQAPVVPPSKKLEGQALSCPIIILNEMEEAGRKHPPHFAATERHNTPIIVFLTVCTKDRKPILANPAAHEMLLEAWRVARSWMTGRYIVMPDHVHLFCAPGDLIAQPLMTWVKYWKSHSARHWPLRGDAPIWQRHFWDTQLRRGENYDAKWEYVVENPVRAGLVNRSEDWPYQGELNVLRW